MIFWIGGTNLKQYRVYIDSKLGISQYSGYKDITAENEEQAIEKAKEYVNREFTRPESMYAFSITK
jgi:hypothetical protein